MGDPRKLTAEALGTFWLVLGGCGSAVFAAQAIGALGVALAFGLTVLTGAYAFGSISGGHFNPAVTIGLVLAKRFDQKEAPGYIGAQIVGAIVAGGVMAIIANGVDGFDLKGETFAANGFGKHSPGGFNLAAGFIAEVVLTAFFLFVIVIATRSNAPVGFAPVAIGLCLTLIHLISIPITNTSVNPARSIGPAIFAGGWALGQLWMFILAPIIGAAIGAVGATWLLANSDT